MSQYSLINLVESSIAQREALDKLEQLRKRYGDNIPSEVIFQQEWLYENPTDFTQPTPEQWRKRLVPTGLLHFLQEDVEYIHVKMYLEGAGRSGNDPIRVVEYEDGRLNVADGHHRVAATMLLNKHSIPALVATIESFEMTDDGDIEVVWK